MPLFYSPNKWITKTEEHLDDICYSCNCYSKKNFFTLICPLKANWQVDDSGSSEPYQRIDHLTWAEAEKEQGKIIKIEGFPTGDTV